MNKVNIETKKTNFTTILKVIIDKGPISKREIEKESLLSWGTVSQVTNELLSLGFIEEEKTPNNQLGRTPSLLSVSNHINLMLGIDINILGLSFVVSNIANNALYKRNIKLLSNKKEDIIKQLLDNTSEILDMYKPIEEINISMQGKVDTLRGVSISVEHFDDWEYVEIKKIFEKKFNKKTFLYHDPDCLMMQHYSLNQYNLKNYSRIALVKLDEGIGFSLMIDNNIYKTKDGYAPEIGHNTIDLSGPKCACGKNGCLETYSSLHGLVQKYNQTFNKKTDINEYLGLLEEDDSKAKKILKENMKYLGLELLNISNIIGPEIIIIDGLLSKYSYVYIDEIRKVLDKNGFESIKIETAEYIENGAALGANNITIENILTNIIFKSN